jgi:GAF domain
MDQYSSMGSSQYGTMTQSSAAAAVARQLVKPELRFPGEDGGQSLAAWARRDLEATLQLLADRAQYITGGTGAAIALRDGDLIMCRASSGPSAPQVGSYFKTLRCDDAMSDPRVNHDSCKALGIASFAVMPLVRDDEVIGIFEIFSNQPRAFHERDLLALERMGEMVNTALDQVKHPRTQPVRSGLDLDAINVRQTNASAEHTVLLDDEESVPASTTGVAVPQPPTDEGPKATAKFEFSPVPGAAPPAAKTAEASASVSWIGTCTQCGFPVSGGRKLCLDCEAASEKHAPAQPSTSTPPAFLAGLEAEKIGLKHWIISHRYLLGTIAMTAATVLVLLFR